jgi:hypothetical protein
MTPIVLASGKGSNVFDVDGNRYVDLAAGFGAVLLGHGAPSVTRALEGRWLYQSGGSVDSVVARSGATAWVQTNSSGTLYDFTFEPEGDFTFQWASAVTLFGGTSRSSCVEKGSWSLSGSLLTLEPSSQRCTYVSNTGLSQDKEDVDLSARQYELTDIEFETIVTTGAALERFSGLELRVPPRSGTSAASSSSSTCSPSNSLSLAPCGGEGRGEE